MSIPKLSHYPLPRTAQLPENRVDWQIEPERAALLIHDMQNYFIGFYGDNNPLIDAVVANIQALKSHCYENNIPVYYTAQPIKQGFNERGLLRDMWGDGLQDPAQQPVMDALQPTEKDIVLTKWRYSAFQKCDFETRLSDSGRDQLLIVGIYAHIGVMTTAVDAFMRDIQPFVIGDAVADFSYDEHTMALNFVAKRCGKVINTAEVLGSESLDITTLEGLKAHIVPLIDCEPEEFDEFESLIDYGLDSVQVMNLIALWQQQGIETNFIELAQIPTLSAWVELLEERKDD
ncbi:isochorismatase family protein [Pseudoalteromonas sp. MMG013]|uniref:isochorismatase family protein n=1 Tax=unclassified Pseudoalteromonas TaxID=194690 RepID=UPI001B37E7D2|nr:MULTISPECIES: isochorismatase family protein [unclassified Pseudoalteromonas]MBQ4844777.1 isochorismatase family protein [Pseudoalteromonas sp. MMG005]MBQ4862067.1 isochorismatase family protein [Pseudoalteromonas sp. MMG013]